MFSTAKVSWVATFSGKPIVGELKNGQGKAKTREGEVSRFVLSGKFCILPVSASILPTL